MSHPKASIVVYLASAPPFLLELLYVCILNILLTVLIFSVREKVKLLKSNSKKVTTGPKQKVTKPKINKSVHYYCQKPSERRNYSTTSLTQNSVWSEEEEEQESKSTFPQSLASNDERRERLKSNYRPQQGRGDRLTPSQKSSLPSSRIYKKISDELIDEMTPPEYESYMISMTTMWNKLLNKKNTERLPLSVPDGDHPADPPTPFLNDFPMESLHPTEPISQAEPIDSETMNTFEEWKTHTSSTVSGISQTDSTMAVRGSSSEINVHSFTDSEVKILDYPDIGVKDSKESIYSGQTNSNFQNPANDNSWDMKRDFTRSDVSASSMNSSFKTNSGIKSNFDIIFEEK